MPDIDANPAAHPQLGCALEPGDAIAFCMLALHASSGSATRWCVFSARYLGEDARHAPRPWRTSPPFEGLAQRLADRSVMDGALFPRVV